MPVGSYSPTPALNTSINGIPIGEGSPASGYNDALRQIMADIAAWTAAYGVSFPITIANGGTGQITALGAFNALAAAGGTIGAAAAINGAFTRQGYGVHPHFASTSMTGGRIYVQASGSDPTSSPGDIVFEY